MNSVKLSRDHPRRLHFVSSRNPFFFERKPPIKPLSSLSGLPIFFFESGGGVKPVYLRPRSGSSKAPGGPPHPCARPDASSSCALAGSGRADGLLLSKSSRRRPSGGEAGGASCGLELCAHFPSRRLPGDRPHPCRHVPFTFPPRF